MLLFLILWSGFVDGRSLSLVGPEVYHTAHFRMFFWAMAALTQPTFPLSCQSQRPVDDDINLCSAVSHRHTDLLQSGLQGRLPSWKTSGN